MTAGLIATKSLIVALVCTLARLKLSTAIRSGLLLSQGGEFAFVIFGLAQTHGILLPRQVGSAPCNALSMHRAMHHVMNHAMH